MADLRADLDRLEEILESEEPAAEALGDLGSPDHLHSLLYAALGTLVRRGPAAGERLPARLLALARDAAGSGLVRLTTAGVLRETLRGLEKALHDEGAWEDAKPLWWQPLPKRSAPEELWNDLGEWQVQLPSAEDLEAGFKGPGAPTFFAAAALLHPDLTARLHAELEAAFEGQRLELSRAGVGSSAAVTARRTDWVRYLAGTEPELLEAAPAVAALVQWLLARLGPWLAEAFPGKPLFPPQTSMLARYPAPSAGYHAHLDNPGGERDNHRALTLTIYLNAPGAECAGGELALWKEGTPPSEPPATTIPAASGTGVFLDSRAVAHQVQPVAEGPARWALTLWFQDLPQAPPTPPLPALGIADALLPLPAPPLPAGNVLFHELGEASPQGRFAVRSRSGDRPRAGIVATVYRAGRDADAWCRHHLEAGFDHLLLVFDHAEEPAEAADMESLRRSFPAERVTVWVGSEVAAERWPQLADQPGTALLLAHAVRGGAAYAVAARQTLNAGAALEAARTAELGNAPLDWLLHLDADERFCLEGPGRGGASAPEHFAAAASGGLVLLRYLNHELLAPPAPGAAPRFKLNPRLAAARLGVRGWEALVQHLAMAQTDPRPYFRAYWNGKAAVSVAKAASAAGVHGWRLKDPSPERQRTLAGPSVLHHHFASPEAFRAKYLAMADAEAGTATATERPFEPSPAEAAAVGLIRGLRAEGASEATVAEQLEALHRSLSAFTPAEVEILEEAGALITCDCCVKS